MLSLSLFLFLFLFLFQSVANAMADEVLTVAIPKVPEVFDVGRTMGSYTTVVVWPLHRNLVRLDDSNLIRGDLAYRWQISENHRRFSFCLKRSFFNNGALIDLNSVRYSIRRLADYKDRNIYFKTLKRLNPQVDSDDALKRTNDEPGSFCFSITLAVSYPDFMYLLSSPFMSIVPVGNPKESTIGAGYYRVSHRDSAGKIIEMEKLEVAREQPGPKKIRVFQHDFNQEALERISRGEIDIFFGVTDFRSIPSGNANVNINFLRAMAVSHAFFNLSRPLAENLEWRRDVAALLRWVVSREIHEKPFAYQPHFIPKGLLPATYYARKLEQMSPTDFIQKWKQRRVPAQFRILARLNELSPESVNSLSFAFKGIGSQLHYVSDYFHGTVDYLRQRDYDISFASWVSGFETFDAFTAMLETVGEKTLNKTGVLDKFLAIVQNSREAVDPFVRSELTIKAFNAIEDDSIVVPLYRVYPIVLTSKKVSYQSSEWRYITSLEKIKKKGLIR